VAAAIGLGFIGMALAAVSWALASRRGFNYDYETRTATWLDQGQIRSLHYSDLVRENR
jgi:UDP-N-acetyl-D-mannosaminuronate dehydrogenase